MFKKSHYDACVVIFTPRVATVLPQLSIFSALQDSIISVPRGLESQFMNGQSFSSFKFSK